MAIQWVASLPLLSTSLSLQLSCSISRSSNEKFSECSRNLLLVAWFLSAYDKSHLLYIFLRHIHHNIQLFLLTFNHQVFILCSPLSLPKYLREVLRANNRYRLLRLGLQIYIFFLLSIYILSFYHP